MATKPKKTKPKAEDEAFKDQLRIGLAGPLALAHHGLSSREIAAKLEDQIEAIMNARNS